MVHHRLLGNIFGKAYIVKYPFRTFKQVVQTLHSESEEETVPIQHAIVALGMVP